MGRRAHFHISGFALTEVLVAVLLTALALVGAEAALLQCQADQRAALLRSRAIDLAADLAEALRAAPDAAAASSAALAWQQEASNHLPAAIPQANPLQHGAAPDELAADVAIRLQWHDPQHAAQQLTLPLALAFDLHDP